MCLVPKKQRIYGKDLMMIIKKRKNMQVDKMRKYLENRGWFTFRSPNCWVNIDLMDDHTIDSGGVSLNEAYELQKKKLK